jgi:hypothetical protein
MIMEQRQIPANLRGLDKLIKEAASLEGQKENRLNQHIWYSPYSLHWQYPN